MADPAGQRNSSVTGTLAAMSDQPQTLLILGASGDLTSRLLLPGLGTLLAVEPERPLRVLGADLAELDDQEWRDRLRKALAGEEVVQQTADRIVEGTGYVQADLLDEEGLGKVMAEAGDGPLVIYFALPPQITVQVCRLLEQFSLPEPTRLALEKPFGNDAESAVELNRQLTRLVREEQIHRIDHFLGLNTVLNIVGVRFANRLLAPVWSAEHIERVDITYDETLGLEGRAGYYDTAGALVDMIQSHLLQVLSLFAMEAPAMMTPEEVRSLKAQVLRSTRLWQDSPVAASRRGRYTAGEVEGRSLPDYVAEEGVDPAHETETFAEVVVEVCNGRWKGVPFVLRSGKALERVAKQVEVTFRPPAHVPTGMTGHGLRDRLVLELKPGAMTVQLAVNAEGDPLDLEPKELHAELGKSRMQPYGEVIAGILDGNPLLAIRGDVAEECWRIVTPVLEAWRSGEVPLEEYPAGSSGPERWQP